MSTIHTEIDTVEAVAALAKAIPETLAIEDLVSALDDGAVARREGSMFLNGYLSSGIGSIVATPESARIILRLRRLLAVSAITQLSPEHYATVTALRDEQRMNAGKAPVGECPYCDKLRARGEFHHPRHAVSDRCESGRRPHCTCPICWG